MAYDTTILSAVLRRLEQTRSEHQAQADMRRDQLYKDVPRLREIDRELQGTAASVIRAALDSGKDPEEEINRIRDRNLALQEQKRQILVRCGLSPDYLSTVIDCPICKDSGYTPEGKLCSCVRRMYTDEQTRRLSTILPIETDNFSSFRMDYYSDTVDQRIGQSPRSVMRLCYNACRSYAEHFDMSSGNLLLYGSTGLGKTFLSSCIAKVVSEKGFSVAYDTSIHVFSSYESVRFRGEDSEQAAINLNKYRSADLLILDDLGTEMTSAFTTSCLYDLINTRLMGHKPMIINTNLIPADFSKRYSAAVASRIMGEFTQLRFIGNDIRLLNKRKTKK